jgi:mono/diheme cytochrome c family protein
MPFNQLTDLSGNYVVPGNKTLDTILYEKQQAQLKQNAGDMPSTTNTLTTEQIEGIVAGVAGVGIAVVLAIYVGSKISKSA